MSNFKKFCAKMMGSFPGILPIKSRVNEKNCQLLLIVGRLQYSIMQVIANTSFYLLLEENTTLIGATHVLTFSPTGKTVGLFLTVNECINCSRLQF